MSKQNDTYVKGHADFTNKYTSDSSIGNQSSHRYDDIINLPHHASAHIQECLLMTVQPSLHLLQHSPDTARLSGIQPKQWKRRCSLAKM